jgi:4-amino-4-deoxy-L-arabinose transferase-like glycosyltransferase
VFLLASGAIWASRNRAAARDGRGLRARGGQIARGLDCDPCAGNEWTGTWFLPRGGPYIFGLESLGSSSAELELDGVVIVRASAGVRKERRIYAAGAHAVRVRHDGLGALRLYWLPPGRRGDLEYVPPEALRPSPPASSGAMPSDLAFRDDAVALTLQIALVLALLGFLLRARLGQARPDALCIATSGLALALRLWHLSGFGQTWDEDVYWSSGRNYLQNLLHGDFRARMWQWNFEHPPVAKYLLGFGALWHDGYGPARALCATLGAATCGLIYLIGRDLYSRRVGVGAALLYAVLPHTVAHSQIAGLETPSTFFSTLALWWFVRRRYLGAGVAGGLAAASRFIAGLVFVAMALAALVTRPRGRAEWLRLGASPLIGLATLVAVWPRLWILGPIAGLRASLARLNVQHTPEWFLGRSILTPVPKVYFPVYFVACATPALLLGLALVWLRRERATLVLLPFFLSPFLLAFSPVIQSGMRYLLPALPPAAVLAAAGLDTAAARVRLPAPAVLGAAVMASLLACLWVRPYYLDYYNALVGGPRAALEQRRFVFGWWGEGIASAVEWVNHNAAPGTAVYYNLFPNHVVWLRDDLRVVRSPDEAELLLLNHFQYTRPLPGTTELYRVEVVKGAPLAAVYRRAVAQ